MTPFAWAALVSLYLVWGSTYLAIRVAVETLPPFLMAGVRFVIAGAVLGLACLVFDRSAIRWPTRRELLDIAIVGGFLLVGGNGLVAWGEQTLPSGIAALLVGLTPVSMVLVAWLAFRERQSRIVWLGVLVGFVGVAVLAAPDPSGGFDGAGLAAVVAAELSWAIGSVYASRHESDVSPGLLGTAIEMGIAGVLLLVVGAAIGEVGAVSAPSFDSIAATAYLIVVGSLVGYTAYAWLIRNAPLPVVSTYAYVNPVVAVLLGAALLSEPIGPRTLLAGALIVVAVAMIITARGRANRSVPEAVDGPADARTAIERAA
ncbi:MAG TPA: EamA family transporter [Candidatus Limnocylindrales bacterium]|nr:EamA family transporter [Candidatus Limnocylindrales bacterium]